MNAFFNNILTAHFALVFVATFICLLGFGYPGYRGRAEGGFAGFAWFLWLIAGIICLIVCVKIAFGI